MSAFAKLLLELDEMAKALPKDGDDKAGDKKIAAAAAEGGAADADKGKGKDADADADADVGAEDDADEDAEMSKSFKIPVVDAEGKAVLDTDGKPKMVDAVDGTQMMKALMARVEAGETDLAKALGTAVSLLKAQAKQIETLTSDLKRVADTGRGRKTVLAIHDKVASGDDLNKAEAKDGIPAAEFMAKAMTAQAAGKLTGLEVARAESAINRGLQVPADIISKVLS